MERGGELAGEGLRGGGKVTFHVTFSYFESLDFFYYGNISFKNISCFKDLIKGGVRGRLKREVVCIYIQLIHAVVQQNVTQHCKAIILQLKKNLINTEKRNLVLFSGQHGLLDLLHFIPTSSIDL